MVREHRRLSSLNFLSFRRLRNRSASTPPRHGTPLLTLTDALIIAIASYVDDPRDISHFLLANRRLSTLLTPVLYDTAFLINPYSRSAASALCRAAKLGHVNVVQYLLDRGVSMIDPKPWTGIENPLHVAARDGQLAVVETMLQHEDAAAASLLIDSHGYTPFHLAALNGFASVTRLFLETAGVDVNLRSDPATTQHAATALHYAASWGHDKVVKLLLRSGATPDFTTTDGAAHTPLQWALQNFCSMAALTPIDPTETIVALLAARPAMISQRNPASGRPILHFAATSGDYSPQRRFGEHYSQIRASPSGTVLPRDARGRREAAREMHRRVVALLVANGADIDAVDREGKTALFHAAEHGEEHFVRNFAELGADVGVKADTGETALEMVVVRRMCGEGMEMAEALLDHGGVVELGRGGRVAGEIGEREREGLVKFVKCHETKMRRVQGGGGHHGGAW
ncbi:uncharacterized protein H6S33_003691 [Morchella sextelata]|uniref:uncharacterized protein n=1 Tax=Morchella sextelata TaxID=1174677 RepID=UPI001D046FF7|nr:uncharacterized protein H6S33_003691 [Morchella sextelata]KAH0606857.1 hypothetical protein H6S33_003691 [Morchella sextelata]